MKRFSKVIGFLMALTMVLSVSFAFGCQFVGNILGKDDKKITLSESAVEMSIFDELDLTAELTNLDGEIVWTNSDDAVVNMTEAEDGASVKLVAIKAGTASVTATVGEKSATCEVTVTGTDALTVSLTSATSVTLEVGAKSQIQAAATFKGQAFEKANVFYTVTADPAGCVTVSNNGEITAVAVGSATITAKAKYLSALSEGVEINVTVEPALEVVFEKEIFELYIANQAGLPSESDLGAKLMKGEVEVDGAEISVVSSAEEVAVYEGGKVKALAVGQATLTVTMTKDGKSAVAEIEVVVESAPQITFGQTEEWAHDGVVADMQAGLGLVIENVALPAYTDGTSAAENLIRFQFIPEEIGAGAVDSNVNCKTPFGPRAIYITIQDATTPSNYLTILVRQAWDPGVEETTVGVGVQTNVMAETSANTYYGLDNADPSHWINVITPTSGYGKYVDLSLTGEHLDVENYTEGMLGFVIDGTKLYMQCGGVVKPLWDLTNFAGITAFENYEWPGFAGNNVNIFIKCDDFQNGSTSAKLSIDTLGGATLAAADVEKFSYASMTGKIPAGYEDEHECELEWVKTQTTHHKACTVVGCTVVIDETAKEEGAHEFVNGVCEVCEYACVHEWEDGECTNCEFVCSHDWSDENGECADCDVTCGHDWSNEDGVCKVCGFECTSHSWESGVCGVCGLECSHANRDGNGNCTVCGDGCEHDWSNKDGVCANDCGFACTSHNWQNGVCKVCGFECAHEYEGGVCTVCGVVCEHDWQNGECTVCELVCAHATISDGACTLCGIEVNANLSYGEHAKFAGVPGVIAKMTEGDTLAYTGISNSNVKNSAIIRFQLVQIDDYNGDANYYAPAGAKNIYITIQDGDNPLNYVTVLLSTLILDGNDAYFSYGAKLGARSSIFGEHTVDSTDVAFYGWNNRNMTSVVSMGVDTVDWAGYNYGIGGFSFYNTLLDDGTEHMLALSIEGTKVFFTDAGGDPTTQLIDLAAVPGKTAWSGFDASTLNVYVTTTGFDGADYSELVIDTIGGNSVSSKDIVDFDIVRLGTSLIPESGHEHTFEYTRDVSNHWKACTDIYCFAIEEGTYGAHDLSTGACVCGLSHTHEWDVAYNDLNHFEQCQCTETQNSEPHDFVDGVCECGYTAIRFGQTDSWAHDGVLANMTAGNALVKENVALTEQNESIVRLQLIPLANNKPYNTSNYVAPKGPSTIYVTFQDSANLDNYVTIIITTYKYNDGIASGDLYYSYAASMGARVSSWGDYATTTKDDSSFVTSGPTVGTNGGYGYGYGYGAFSLYGDWLGAANYADYMLGFSIVGTKVYINGAGKNLEMVDLANVEGKDAWTGFTGDSVNVIVSCADFSGVDNALISVDTIGGQTVTSAEGFKFVEVGTALVPSEEIA